MLLNSAVDNILKVRGNLSELILPFALLQRLRLNFQTQPSNFYLSPTSFMPPLSSAVALSPVSEAPGGF